MGIAVMVMGASGSGKSTSLRNFRPGEVGIFNVAGKPLPFRSKLPLLNNPSYKSIEFHLKEAKLKSYVIDDSQYLMAFESFDKAKIRGFDKFVDMAVNFRDLIHTAVAETPDDVIVYFLHHTELADNGNVKAKTLGKMLDNQLTVEGLFSIVLLTTIESNTHYFITNSDGTNPAKSPMGMFDNKIDNDLKLVDDIIRDYYGLTRQEETRDSEKK